MHSSQPWPRGASAAGARCSQPRIDNVKVITKVRAATDYVCIIPRVSTIAGTEVSSSVQISSFRFRPLVALAALTSTLLAQPAVSASTYLARSEVRAFIESMHAEHGIDRAELERILGSAKYQPVVARLIGPERPKSAPPPVRSYPRYRAKFLTNARIAAGIQYWDVHESDLRRAEAQFGVPAEVILGILGVETVYGRNTGSFRVVDALTTIAFDGPRRQDYFREELKDLLLLARDTGFDPLSLKGSYAGAMGLPQFMPSSYRRHAVDFDGDGVIDLAGSPADAIGSIANYLKAHGWSTGEPAFTTIHLPADGATKWVSGLERVHTVADLQADGIRFAASNVPDGAVAVVELPAPGKPSRYLAGFTNFEAITRYNRSTFYATAVLELADAIRSERSRQMSAQAEAMADGESRG